MNSRKVIRFCEQAAQRAEKSGIPAIIIGWRPDGYLTITSSNLSFEDHKNLLIYAAANIEEMYENTVGAALKLKEGKTHEN